MPAACVDGSLQLSISAETIHSVSHFKHLSEYKTRIPAPLFHLSMARCQSGSLLQPLTSAICTIAVQVYNSLPSKENAKKRVIKKPTVIFLVGGKELRLARIKYYKKYRNGANNFSPKNRINFNSLRSQKLCIICRVS